MSIIGHALISALSMALAMGWEILWPLILGFALSGIVQAVVTKGEMSRLLPDSSPRAIVISSALGAAFSSCSYAAVALARSIFRKGADFIAAMAFQFASTNLVLELGIIFSFLWRWELAGHPRDDDKWRTLYELVNSAFPHAGVAFSDMHIAIVQVVARNDAELKARAREVNDLAHKGRYPSGHLVPTVSRGFAAFERREFATAIEALEPIAGELERLGGSRAQLDLVEFTLLRAYVSDGRVDDARRMLSGRHRGSSSLPVLGLAAVY